VSCGSRHLSTTLSLSHRMAAPVIADGGTGDRNQALERVFNLCSLPLLTNSHPNIHASSDVIDYRVDLDAGFCDRNAFVAAMAKYLEEAAEQAKMVLSARIDKIRKICSTTAGTATREYLIEHFCRGIFSGLLYFNT